MDSFQLFNTAIIKSKEKKISMAYEDRLKNVCDKKIMNALNTAVMNLAESKKIAPDQAAIEIIDTIRELDTIWNDYVLMEGIEKLKDVLNHRPEDQPQQ